MKISKKLWKQVLSEVNLGADDVAAYHLQLDRSTQEKIEDGLAQGSKAVLDWTLYVRLEESWGVGATLSVDFRNDWNATRKDEKGDYHYECRVSVNWSSTERSIAKALASVALYQKLINLGASIQARFEGEDIVAEAPTSKA